MSFVTGLEAVWASEGMLSEYGGKKPLFIKVCWDVTHCHCLELLNVQESECENIRCEKVLVFVEFEFHVS
jgi:hypothetical protein